MALLTVTQFQEHFDTDLGTDALQRLLDDAEASIVQRFGEHASQVDWTPGAGRLLFLSRPADSITEVVETVAEEDTTLDASDYELQFNGRALERQYDGTNGRVLWGDLVKVTYVPVSDLDRRKRVQLDLVKLAIQYEGLDSSKVASVDLRVGDYQDRREAILLELAPVFGFA